LESTNSAFEELEANGKWIKENRHTLYTLSLSAIIGIVWFVMLVPFIEVLKTAEKQSIDFCIHEHAVLSKYFLFFGCITVVLNLIILFNQPLSTMSNKVIRMRHDHNEFTEFFFFLVFVLLAFLSSVFDYHNSAVCPKPDSYIFEATCSILLIDCLIQFGVFCAYDPSVHVYRFGSTDTAKKGHHMLRAVALTANVFWNSFLVAYLIYLPWELSGFSLALDRLADAGRLAFRLHAAISSCKSLYKMLKLYVPEYIGPPSTGIINAVDDSDLEIA